MKKGFGTVGAGNKGHRGAIVATGQADGAQKQGSAKTAQAEGASSGFGGSGLENVLDLDGGAT